MKTALAFLEYLFPVLLLLVVGFVIGYSVAVHDMTQILTNLGSPV